MQLLAGASAFAATTILFAPGWSWAMLLAGFGLVGGSMRRRSAASRRRLPTSC